MSRSSLPANLAARFAGQKILVVGDIIADEYLSGDCSRLSPEAPVPVLRVSRTRLVMGGAANAAANVASLGGRVVLIGMVGADETGDRLANYAASHGVEMRAVTDGRPTIRKVRVVGQQQQLLRLDYEQATPVGSATETQIIDTFLNELDGVRVVVISDYAKGVVTERVCRTIIDASHRAGAAVIVDPRPQHRTYYLDCDYLTPNWNESQELLGQVGVTMSDASVIESARDLSRALRSNVLLTLGAHGMCFFGRDEREQFSVPTQAKEVFDVSGAGDTVVAAFALALASDLSHSDAVMLANRAAGRVVAKLGTATVTLDELMIDDVQSARLVARDGLAGLASALRTRGKRIVTINGSFDVLHAGHLRILTEAREQADVLVVGLNSDESVRALKGPTRPIVPQQQRADLLLGLRCVDYVHVFDEATPIAFIEQIAPDVHVNGLEYGQNCVEASTVRRLGGRLHLVPRSLGLSTTSIVQAIDRRDSSVA